MQLQSAMMMMREKAAGQEEQRDRDCMGSEQVIIEGERGLYATPINVTVTLSDMDPHSHPPKHNNIHFYPQNFFYFAQLTLRVLVIGFTLAAAITMTTSNQSVAFFGIVMDARYTYSSSFRFKMVADSIVCGLSLLSVILLLSLNRPKSNPNNYFYLFLHDLVSAVLLLSGGSAAMAIGYVGRFGQPQTGWIPICDRVPKFCDKILVSIVSSFLAVICLLVLTIMSVHKLKSHPI
ncbi:UNVERIFIED_CONTAM: CASP-like protein 1F1 [Sesamum calycinum]|uniref:CASP-like protein n=1 Tax=Sesamum calycinum TaxID=2727403 RepID=A0AAW2MJR0_9LAMI